jgi:hypothetical protein
MKKAFQSIALRPYSPVNSRYAADGFWDGVCRVETEPVDAGAGDNLGSGTPPGDDLAAQLEALQNQLAAKEKALANSRQVEKNYRRLEAIVGDTNPEKLQELRDADQRLKQEQSDRERMIIEAKNSVTAEYKGTIDELQKQNSTLSSEREKIKMTFDLFKEFNQAEGDGTKFDGFVTLAQGLFERTDSGAIQVKDANGRTITTKDEDSTLRPATPREFMKLLIAGKLEEYNIPNADFLKMSFAPYNKAMGAGLPSTNGAPMPKDLGSLSQSQLGSLIFGG